MFSLYFRLKAHLDAKGGPRKKKKKRVRRNEAGKYGLKYMHGVIAHLRVQWLFSLLTKILLN
jgi:hypothetical protein